MTDQELKDLVASLAVDSKETSAKIREFTESIKKWEEESKRDYEKWKEEHEKWKEDSNKEHERWKEENERRKKAEEMWKEDSNKEHERWKEENERRKKAEEKWDKENERRKKAEEMWDEDHKHLAGISESNGLVAEQYFYNALRKRKSLGNIHFDDVYKGFRKHMKIKNGEKIKGQYDVVLVNGNSVGLVEIKYKARTDDVEDIAERQAKVFKLLFPEYADYTLYLAVATYCADEYVMQEAKKRGIAVLTQKGEIYEEHAENMMEYVSAD